MLLWSGGKKQEAGKILIHKSNHVVGFLGQKVAVCPICHSRGILLVDRLLCHLLGPRNLHLICWPCSERLCPWSMCARVLGTFQQLPHHQGCPTQETCRTNVKEPDPLQALLRCILPGPEQSSLLPWSAKASLRYLKTIGQCVRSPSSSIAS
jgi:hypothetical protein